MRGKIIGGFIVIMVGITIVPVITKTLDSALIESNSTSAAQTLLSFTPLFFGLVITTISIGIIYSAFNEAGLVGVEYHEEETQSIKPVKPHKQTYLEYVKERLSVENMLKWRI